MKEKWTCHCGAENEDDMGDLMYATEVSLVCPKCHAAVDHIVRSGPKPVYVRPDIYARVNNGRR